jgi:hypothetical protein
MPDYGTPLRLPRAGAGQHSLPNLFLRPQTGVYIGIEIDIDRPRFAPSVFLRYIASRRPLLPSILRLFFGDPPREK